jgi:hypothetical protein
MFLMPQTIANLPAWAQWLFELLPSYQLAVRERSRVMLQTSGVPETLKVRGLIGLFRLYYPQPLASSEVIELADRPEQPIPRLTALYPGLSELEVDSSMLEEVFLTLLHDSKTEVRAPSR